MKGKNLNNIVTKTATQWLERVKRDSGIPIAERTSKWVKELKRLEDLDHQNI